LTAVNLFPVVTRQWFQHHLYSQVVMLSLFTHLFSYCPVIVGGMLNAVSVFMWVSCWCSLKMPNLRFWFGGCYPSFRDRAGRKEENWVRAPIALPFSSEGACVSPVTL